MKIQNHGAVQATTTRKSQKKDTSGVFQSLLESEITPPQDTEHSNEQTATPAEQPPMQTLHTSIALLDQAMDCLESGQAPPEQLLNDIENLRNEVHRHSHPGQQTEVLQEADTILAVEAARIRSLNH